MAINVLGRERISDLKPVRRDSCSAVLREENCRHCVTGCGDGKSDRIRESFARPADPASVLPSIKVSINRSA